MSGVEAGVHSGPLVIIRFLQVFFSLTSLGLMASTKKEWYEKFPAFQYLVGAAAIAFIYCGLLFLLSLVKICMSDKKFAGGLGWLQVILDGVVGLILFSAASAAAGYATQLREDGLCKGNSWQDLEKYKRASAPCAKSEGAIAMGFIGSFLILCTHWWFINSTHKRL